MARNIMINRDEAELLVDLLENNYTDEDPIQPSGTGADLAVEIRELFGMAEQPELYPHNKQGGQRE